MPLQIKPDRYYCWTTTITKMKAIDNLARITQDFLASNHIMIYESSQTLSF